MSSLHVDGGPGGASLRWTHRVALLAVILGVGAGLSLHLRAQRVSAWWVPFVLLLASHGMIIGGIATLLAHPHGAEARASAGHAGNHEHGERSAVIRTPRIYDWLVRFLTLGGEGRFRRRTLDLAELRAGDAVLDVGCGTGTLLLEVAARVGASGAAHGIEPSDEMVEHARRKTQAQGVAATIQQGTADHLPFPDCSYDVVLCTLVLHHLPPSMQADAIREMSRVLRPGGRIVIADLHRPRRLAAVGALITLFHAFRGHATAPNWERLTLLLEDGGVRRVARHSVWGGAVDLMVGRKGS